MEELVETFGTPGKEGDRILKRRTLEPDEDPEKMLRHPWNTP